MWRKRQEQKMLQAVAAENGASANIVEKKFNNKNKNEGKMQMQNSGKPKKTINFKKKKN